jgi:hypothetical protein
VRDFLRFDRDTYLDFYPIAKLITSISMDGGEQIEVNFIR